VEWPHVAMQVGAAPHSAILLTYYQHSFNIIPTYIQTQY
jgi:hypothetical protein